jgi:hypothetical protein
MLQASATPDILILGHVKHLGGKKRIGRVGYNIISKTETLNIINDAINAHQIRGCPKTLKTLQELLMCSTIV